MTDKTFHDLEHEAWSGRAKEYDNLFASVSTQAIGYILDDLGFIKGKRHLDVACGTGHLVAAACARGALSEGLDFAEPMIEVARATYPKAYFQVGDATKLPYKDQSFEFVTCAFGLQHMQNPQTAMNEAYRVLKSGGCFAFTLWFGPDEGNDFQKVFNTALSRFALDPVALPETWVQFRYADPKTCERFTRQAGFASPVFQRLPIVWRLNKAEEAIRILKNLSTRTKMVLDGQPPAIQAQIYGYVVAEIEACRRNGIISLAGPALLTTVQKPDG
ncbi:MAG TPA: methyltransferase domain-containing protein [Anaerolineales bacterium]|nr:methyltransferase domain-containing protein [Anaerolineales bacterium]